MGETEQFTRKARGEKRDRDREINKYQGNSFFFNITQTKTYNNQQKEEQTNIHSRVFQMTSLYIHPVCSSKSLSIKKD